MTAATLITNTFQIKILT